jgi:hypothetical protein
MLSENLQATQWATDDGISPTPPTPPHEKTPRAVRETDVGMVWFVSPAPESKINAAKDYEVPAGSPPPIQYARPSSYHVDCVVVTYCDGHQDFIFDDADYEIYQRAMAPDDDEAGIPP